MKHSSWLPVHTDTSLLLRLRLQRNSLKDQHHCTHHTHQDDRSTIEVYFFFLLPSQTFTICKATSTCTRRQSFTLLVVPNHRNCSPPSFIHIIQPVHQKWIYIKSEGQLFLLGWLSVGRYALSVSPAWWHEPHTLLQEFTSLPVVIPRQKKTSYTDVSFILPLKQNPMVPSLTHVEKKSSRINNNCGMEDKPENPPPPKKTGGLSAERNAGTAMGLEHC